MESFRIVYLDENLNWIEFGQERAATGTETVTQAWATLCRNGQVGILRLRPEWLEARSEDGDVFTLAQAKREDEARRRERGITSWSFDYLYS